MIKNYFLKAVPIHRNGLFIAHHNVFAQTIIDRDPEILQMVNEISKDSFQSYITTLVAFGKRKFFS